MPLLRRCDANSGSEFASHRRNNDIIPTIPLDFVKQLHFRYTRLAIK